MRITHYKDGTPAYPGDIIQWYCHDSDDGNTWSFIGLLQYDYVIYLSGGIDFGHGIGNKWTHKGVIEESLNNDEAFVGITYVGKCKDLARHISEFGEKVK